MSTRSREELRPSITTEAKPATALNELALVFSRTGSLTFGGGSSTIAGLQRQLVTRRRWLDETQFGLSYALCRITPGTNLLAFCAAAGWSIRGWPGALVALLAASLPCSAIAIVLTSVYEFWSHNHWVHAAVRGALAAAVGLLVATSWQLIWPHLRRGRWLRTVVLASGSVLLSAGFGISPVRVLAMAAILGLLWANKEA